jgi:hypothetical protein
MEPMLSLMIAVAIATAITKTFTERPNAKELKARLPQ